MAAAPVFDYIAQLRGLGLLSRPVDDAAVTAALATTPGRKVEEGEGEGPAITTRQQLHTYLRRRTRMASKLAWSGDGGTYGEITAGSLMHIFAGLNLANDPSTHFVDRTVPPRAQRRRGD